MLRWVVGWGATWWVGQGGKLGKNQVMMKIGEKNKGNQKYDFFHQNKVQLDDFRQKTGINCIFGLKSSKK